jgi:hypothetical protein
LTLKESACVFKMSLKRRYIIVGGLKFFQQ